MRTAREARIVASPPTTLDLDGEHALEPLHPAHCHMLGERLLGAATFLLPISPAGHWFVSANTLELGEGARLQ